jgi:hypothetical protein
LIVVEQPEGSTLRRISGGAEFARPAVPPRTRE